METKTDVPYIITVSNYAIFIDIVRTWTKILQTKSLATLPIRKYLLNVNM